MGYWNSWAAQTGRSRSFGYRIELDFEAASRLDPYILPVTILCALGNYCRSRWMPGVLLAPARIQRIKYCALLATAGR